MDQIQCYKVGEGVFFVGYEWHLFKIDYRGLSLSTGIVSIHQDSDNRGRLRIIGVDLYD